MIPCEQEDFAKFISDIISKKHQAIENDFFGIFEFSMKNLDDIIKLIEHRVKEQNEAHLVELSVKLTYDDNSSVIFDSYSEFLNYAEIKPLVTESIHITWIYLVKFKGKTHPQKQEINLSIYSDGYKQSNSGRINFLIKHTARSWGVDIESLLIGKVKSLITDKKPTKVSSLGRAISALVSLLLLSMSLIYSYLLFSTYNEELTSKINEFSSQEKIDFIIDNLLYGNDYSYVQFLFILLAFVSLIISSLIYSSVLEMFIVKQRAYVLISEEAIKQHKLSKIKTNQIKSNLISIGLSILAGIISTVLYKLLIPDF